MLSECGDRACPERLADDRGLHQHALGFVRERVDPRGDQRLDARRDHRLVEGATGDRQRPFAKHRRELLGVKRRATGPLEHDPRELGVGLRQALSR